MLSKKLTQDHLDRCFSSPATLLSGINVWDSHSSVRIYLDHDSRKLVFQNKSKLVLLPVRQIRHVQLVSEETIREMDKVSVPVKSPTLNKIHDTRIKYENTISEYLAISYIGKDNREHSLIFQSCWRSNFNGVIREIGMAQAEIA